MTCQCVEHRLHRYALTRSSWSTLVERMNPDNSFPDVPIYANLWISKSGRYYIFGQTHQLSPVGILISDNEMAFLESFREAQ